MNPVSFGPDDGLYGVVTEAQGVAERAVLICPPIGQEMIRSHRAVRRLADRLSINGADVLRFDYFGTGHSQGGDDEGTPDRWVDDIRAAATFLRSVSGASALTVIGLRAGALLSLAAEVRAVRRLILWDPVLDPEVWLDSLREEAAASDDPHELENLPSVVVRSGLNRIDVQKIRRKPKDIVVIDSISSPDSTRAVELLGQGVDIVEASAPSAWSEEGTTGAGAIPVPAIEAIAEHAR